LVRRTSGFGDHYAPIAVTGVNRVNIFKAPAYLIVNLVYDIDKNCIYGDRLIILNTQQLPVAQCEVVKMITLCMQFNYPLCQANMEFSVVVSCGTVHRLRISFN